MKLINNVFGIPLENMKRQFIQNIFVLRLVAWKCKMVNNTRKSAREANTYKKVLHCKVYCNNTSIQSLFGNTWAMRLKKGYRKAKSVMYLWQPYFMLYQICIVKVVPMQDPMCSSCRTMLEQTIWNIVHEWQMFEFAWVLYTLNLTLPWWYTLGCNKNILRVPCDMLWCVEWKFVCTL